MKQQRCDLITEILTRGVQEVIVRKELEERLRSKKTIKLYLGIDPTGSQLHLGHTIALRKLRAFQELGHEVTFLIGSFTALIGDTSDKESERQPLTQEQIDKNFATYRAQASKILDFSKIKVVYNSDWLEKLSLRELIELANKFTVQQMIEREMYQKRLAAKKPIGLHEFLYPLMQGFDSVALDVDLEIGGNDQLFNMLAGRTLQKKLRNRDKHVMTLQLLEGTDGRKMAKTNMNIIAITDPPNEKYGRIMSMRDELITQYFLLCTDIPEHEISEMKCAMQSGENPRDFKMKLSHEIVRMYDGDKAAHEAEREFIKIFQKHEKPSEIALKHLPKATYTICDLLSETGLATSKSDARRLIEGGGVRVADARISKFDSIIALTKKPTLIQVGKRKYLHVSTDAAE